MGAFCGPGRDGITSTHIPPAGTQPRPPKDLGKVPRRRAGGASRAWPPRAFLAVSPSQAPARRWGAWDEHEATAHVRGSLLGVRGSSPSSLTFSSYLPPIPALSSDASPLWSPCGWRTVNCLAIEAFGGELPWGFGDKGCCGEGMRERSLPAGEGRAPTSCEIRESEPRPWGPQEGSKPLTLFPAQQQP